MFDLLGWSIAAGTGLIASTAIWVLSPAGKPLPPTRGPVHVMAYAWPVKALVAALLPLTMVVLFEAAHAFFSSQWLTALVAAGIFASITGFHVYQVFFVRFAFDRTSVFYDSPLCREKTVPWQNLREAGSSVVFQSDYLVFDGIGRVWCFSFSSGYDVLDDFLDRKTSDLLGSQT